MLKRWPEKPEVTVPGDRRRPKITIHRRKLERQDIRIQSGIKCTSPARTALDIARRLTDEELTRATEEARLAGYLRLPSLTEIAERNPYHPGCRRLRKVVAGSAKRPTRSKLERLFVKFAKRYGLPTPQVNVFVAGYEVDILFGHERVIVELDGYETHATRASFERDRERDAAMLAAGYVTIRITWERLLNDPQREAIRLLRILENRRQQVA
jgi:very-short-patch-repair endonuclease